MLTMRWLACVIWLAAGAAGTPKANAPSVVSPNIILITLDTTRADRMGFLGSKRGLTPNLDALAHQSTVFTRAYAQAPLTTVSHATILTGTYPQFHQVLDFTYPLAKDLPYAPDILRAHGYRTAAFLGSLVLDAGVGAPVLTAGLTPTILISRRKISRAAATRRAANSAPGGGRERKWWRARWHG